MEGINNIVYIYGIIHVAYVIMLYNLQYFFLSLNDSTASLYCTNGFISEPVYGCGFGGRNHRASTNMASGGVDPVPLQIQPEELTFIGNNNY